MTKQHAPRAPMPLWVWYNLAVVLVATLGLAIGGILWTNHAIKIEDRRVNHAIAVEDAKVRAAIVAEARKQCSVYTLLDGSYHKTPPTTAAGKAFAAVIHRVVADLGCS